MFSLIVALPPVVGNQVLAEDANSLGAAQEPTELTDDAGIFDRDNFVAWCIEPFDDRESSPDQRAEMLRRLGLRRYVYDYRAEHVPTLDAEMEAIQK